MLHIEQMQAGDLARLAAVEPGMGEVFAAGMPEDVLMRAGAAYTAFHDAQPVAAVGLIPVHERRALAWAMVSRCDKHVFARIHREVMRGMERFQFNRIEAAVRCDFSAGRRWAERLGFTCEAERMAGYLPDGRDAALYARVRS